MKQNYANYANKNLRKRRTIKMSNEQHNTIDTVNETGQLNKLGFWVFLTAEIALFGTLFATFLVLQKSGSYGGASTPELFELPLVMIMTFLLLVSSYTCGIAVYFMRKENVKMMMIWMIITVLLGAGFVGFELYEFTNYVGEGVTAQFGLFWCALFFLFGELCVGFEFYECTDYVGVGFTAKLCSFWSAFFILLGTHGLHVTVGIFWISGVLIQIARRGLNEHNAPKIFIGSLYWHFLD